MIQISNLSPSKQSRASSDGMSLALDAVDKKCMVDADQENRIPVPGNTLTFDADPDNLDVLRSRCLNSVYENMSSQLQRSNRPPIDEHLVHNPVANALLPSNEAPPDSVKASSSLLSGSSVNLETDILGSGKEEVNRSGLLVFEDAQKQCQRGDKYSFSSGVEQTSTPKRMKNLDKKIYFASPLDCARSGKKLRAKQLGMSPCANVSFEMNQSFPRMTKSKLIHIGASGYKCTLDSFTGYGHGSQLSEMASHDINYLAISGLLSLFRRPNTKHVPPVNLLADFAGGSVACSVGILAALLERSRTGKGQVVDCRMAEGASYIASFLWRCRHSLPVAATSDTQPGTHLLDTGAPFYDTYLTKDDGHVAVAALEPQFYVNLLEGLQLDPELATTQYDQSSWEQLRGMLADKFREKTRAEWTELFHHLDACVTPVLSFEEAPSFPHNRDTGAFYRNCEGTVLPRPAPRLENHPSPPNDPVDTVAILVELGLSEGDAIDCANAAGPSSKM